MRDAEHRFPESRTAATLAITKDAFVGGADVRFEAGVFDLFEGLARIANEGDKAELFFQGADGWKVDFPEIGMGIEKGNTVGVDTVLRAEMADDANFRFLVFVGPAKNEFLFGRELVFGDDAGAVEAEEDGGGVLGEDAAIQIAADEEDGNFFRDASAAAHNLWWQARGQSGGCGGTIQYQKRR